MRRQLSAHIFKKYQPHQSRWSHFLRWRQRRKNKRLSFAAVAPNKRFSANPFKKNRPQKRKLTFIFKLFIFFLVLIVWFILLLYFPFFKVDKLEVKGLENIKYQEISEFIKGRWQKCHYWPCNNYFFIDTNQIYDDLLNQFAIKKLTARKQFPDKLIINLEEKKTSLLYDNGQSYYLVDESGQAIKFLRHLNDSDFILREVSTTTTSTEIDGLAVNVTTTVKVHIPNNVLIKAAYGKFPLLYDKRFNHINVGNSKVIIPPELVLYVVELEQKFKQLKYGEIKYFVLEYIDGGLKVVTTNRWDLLVDFKVSMEQQLKNLKVILNNEKPLEYIDLRAGDRIYWK